MPLFANFTVPAVVPLPSGVTRLPVTASIAFHCADVADISIVCSAALLSATTCISPFINRMPALHSQTLPAKSAMPLGLRLCRHSTGPEPVNVRAVPAVLPGSSPSCLRPINSGFSELRP